MPFLILVASPLVSKCLSVMVQAIVRGERGEGERVVQSQMKYICKITFINLLWQRTKSYTYLFIYFIKLTEASLHELT